MICISLSLSAFVFPLQLIFFLSEKRLFTMSTLCEYIGRVAVGDDCSLLLSLHHFSPRLCLAPSRRRARAAHPDTPSPERQTDRQASGGGSRTVDVVVVSKFPPPNMERSRKAQPNILYRRNHQHDTHYGSTSLHRIIHFIRMPGCTDRSPSSVKSEA